MKIVVARPPNFAAIAAVFPLVLEKRGVIYSYGERIFNPDGMHISKELQAHEAVHGIRQGASEAEILQWWERYLAEPLFRLDEEIHAHHAEYLAARKRHGPRPKDLSAIAERLSGALYGNLLTIEQAKHAIITGEVR